MTGVEFREIREKLGMTQDTLSKEIGINIRQISRIETGEADV
ncbi:helix-turn-helix domain-containing protein, partial [uncultured Helicobacter sp.]